MATIRRFGVLSVAKVLGIVYAIIGVFAGIFFALISMLGAAAGGTEGPGAMGAAFGMGFAIAAPFLYGGIGFVGGAIMAFLYNLIAGFVGGIEVDLG